MTLTEQPLAVSDGNEAWPPEADLVLSALEAAGGRGAERRKVVRIKYRVRASLRLFAESAGNPPSILYTRDVNERGMGFITPHRLPLGYGGMVELVGPNGQTLQIHCTLFRCREAAPGWFEGSLYFNRPQAAFAAEHFNGSD